MKKIISIALCIIIALIGTVSIFASEMQSDESSVGEAHADSKFDYTILKTEMLPPHYGRVFIAGEYVEISAGISVTDLATGEEIKYPIDSNSIIDVYMPGSGEYKCGLKFKKNGIGTTFDTTGGTYELMKVKLSDFDSYFNEDGTMTATIDGVTHNYNFKEENGFYSSLPFFSGNTMTAATPDKDGYAYIYVSTKLGEETTHWANCSMEGSKKGTGRYCTFTDLMIGNVDKKYTVEINDATAIQKYLSNMISFDRLSLRNADANQDGKIDVDDVTLIQKYVAGFDI